MCDVCIAKKLENGCKLTYVNMPTPKETCSCGEPHISKRITHCCDGKPCYVTDSHSQPEQSWEKDFLEYIKGAPYLKTIDIDDIFYIVNFIKKVDHGAKAEGFRQAVEKILGDEEGLRIIVKHDAIKNYKN